MHTRLLHLQPLNEETFRPFGQVITQTEAMPGTSIGTGLYWADCLPAPEGRLSVGLIRYHRRDLQISRMERHTESGQSFLHLDGGPALLVVAVGDDPDDPHEHPNLERLTGFVIPPKTGIRLERGTWHVSPFPLHDFATYLVLAAPGTIEVGTDWRTLSTPVQQLAFTMSLQSVSELRT